MKNLIIIGLVLMCVNTISYASSNKDCHDKTNGNRFTKNLNLEEDRADRVHAILSSYSEIGDLYKTNNHDKIPEFLARKEAELAAVLTPEEMMLFKEEVGKWAKTKDFSTFMKHPKRGSHKFF